MRAVLFAFIEALRAAYEAGLAQWKQIRHYQRQGITEDSPL